MYKHFGGGKNGIIQKNFHVGNIIVMDQKQFVHSWSHAIITMFHTGSDGHVRAVTLSLSYSLIVRLRAT